MSYPKQPRTMPIKPKIVLPLRGQCGEMQQTPVGYVSTPYGQSPIIMTPVVGEGSVIYNKENNGFVFTQFRGIKDFTKTGLSLGERSAFWLYEKVSSWSKRWFTHIFLFVIVLLYSIAGAMIFVTVEGTQESKFRSDMRKFRNETLSAIKDLNEDNSSLKDPQIWKGKASNLLSNYEEKLFQFYKSGLMDKKEKVWTFWNAVFYCGTIYTTIGYGHIAPTTTTGRAITIVYAIFGIPMFLIILADFGKLFTRCIKFLWAFIRRLYYTGSCRKVRKTAPMQEVMKGVQLVYDLATFRRPSNMNAEIDATQMPSLEGKSFQGFNENLRLPTESVSVPDTPVTPTMSTFAIDDEFNLPISVAISILLGYIFIGATIYHFWEDNWSFFESFYFVFISMSTIGFGDYVPTHPIYMMCSIIYLVFGLALTSMCINVVQVMLSDHFKQASQKLGATIGLEVSGDGAQMQPILLHPVDAKDICTQEADSHDNDSNLKVAKSS
ncbi:TWiK family of potassium channels protein 7 isoform X2 [Leptopilina heterotoma]|uniref:TWiK family of potassium channels protein 7 isoform X2 n=1 Tax=Leptopilina heterotoma TaxID=63436 RepID=UPI001CA946CF|nr:TWiK family of potassium channels protein 7 isoform X2 [Leptopilina heterotoma]XP_043469262.1 TWiK family of potassium channels protein 7 isoform X2 [Leptopilina heterotoma]